MVLVFGVALRNGCSMRCGFPSLICGVDGVDTG